MRLSFLSTIRELTLTHASRTWTKKKIRMSEVMAV